EASAEYLGAARGVRCDPSQVLVTTGSQQALQLCARVLLNPGDRICLEEPGYPGARDAFRASHAEVEPIPLDHSGIDVERMARQAKSARAVYVTPSHQYPLGMILSAPRRLQLLDWARRRGAWIFEDDYDSECRYDTQPLASLHGLDRDARVLYIGTFSKILFPALRVGYLVIPHDLIARFRRFRQAMDDFPSPLYQVVLAELIRDGHFARHLRRMRAVYAERRRALERALVRELGDATRIVGDRAGMHLVVLLPPAARDHDIAARAARRGLSVLPLSSCYAGRRTRPGLVLGYGATRLSEIPDAVRRLASVVGDGHAPSSR
ncbi:MAG TPA: PLP-dependent aminotransferase family protein, partial [Kofleriaceae bacterium]|nr:PLP-dependent aminotransferase family protein [Kofleriaceae bacterium]